MDGQNVSRPTRGFTTLQLLDLFGILTDNARRAANSRLGPNDQVATGPAAIRSDILSNFGIDIGDSKKTSVIEILSDKSTSEVSSAAYFGARRDFERRDQANVTDPVAYARADAIERSRPRIFQAVNLYLANGVGGQDGNGGLLASQYFPAGIGNNAGAPSKGNSLGRVLKTSYTWQKQPKAPGAKSAKEVPQNLQMRVQAIAQVLQLTDPNAPPGKPDKPSGGVGQTREASESDVRTRTGASSGFATDKVVNMLARLSRADYRNKSQNRVRVANAVRKLAGLSPDTNEAAAEAAIVNLTSGGTGVAQRQTVRQLLEQVLADSGGRIAGLDAVWSAQTKSALSKLLGGLFIAKPDGGYVHDENARSLINQGGQSMNALPANPDPATFTRYVFDSLALAFLQSNAQQDEVPEEVAKRQNSSARRVSVPTGFLPATHESVEKLDLTKPKSVSTVLRKVRAGQYSMAALQRIAQKMGINDLGSMRLRDTVEAVILDVALQQNTVLAEQGNPGALLIMTSVLSIPGFANLLKNTGMVGEARAAVGAKLDAHYGNLTVANCAEATKKGYITVEDLKNVAKDRALVNAPDKKADLCRVLSGQRDEPAPISGRREENVYEPAPKSGKSGKRSQALPQGQILQGLTTSAGTVSALPLPTPAFPQGGQTMRTQTASPRAGNTFVPPAGTVAAPAPTFVASPGGTFRSPGGTARPPSAGSNTQANLNSLLE